MANKQKILIVDNDLTLAESLSSTLQKEFYLTSIVKDGQEAVREFSSISPDLILSELILPGMDGYQLCRQIRAISRIPIIIISSLPMLIAYPFFQQYFVKGVMLGSLKE